MAIETFVGFAFSDIETPDGAFPVAVGDEVRLRPDWTVQTHALTYVVDDQDGSDPGTGDDGRQFDDDLNHSPGTTANQTGRIDTADGTTIASGDIYPNDGFEVLAPDGSIIRAWAVYVDGNPVGLIADGPIQPGVTYEITRLFDAEGSDEPLYDDLHDQTYNQAADNDVTGSMFADTIETGEGADTVSGGSGNDSVDLGTGNDDFGSSDAEDGDDTIHGGVGADTISGGGGNDSITGDHGADSLSGGAGDDTIEGGSQADAIAGDAGDDVLRGDGGNDRLTGGRGNDSLDGGTGNDRIRVVELDGEDTIDGGDGRDTLEFEHGASGEGVDVAITGPGSGTYDFRGTADRGTFTSIEMVRGTDAGDSLDASGAGSGLSLDGRGGDDAIFGGTGADTVSGGDGDDTIFGGDGADQVDLGDGDDRFGNFQTDGGADVVRGGAGDDTINAGAGDDSLYGEGGDDYLVGAGGNDYVDGGSGSDFITVTDDHGRDTVVGGEDGSDADELRLVDWTSTDGARVTFDGDGAGRYEFDGTSAGGEFSEFETVSGTRRDDTIDAGADSAGMALRGRDGDDEVTGGSGDDTIRGDGGDDVLAGGAGDDQVDGGEGDDRIVGGAGDDDLRGGAGDDDLTGGAGSDTVDGGAGDDRLRVGDGDGTDSFIGGSGRDTVDFSDASGGVDIAVDAAGAGTYALRDGSADGTFSGVEAVVTGDGDDNLDAGADMAGVAVAAGAGDDAVTGGSGADQIDGGAGDDVLRGGAGADTLRGGDGNDTLEAGAGGDVLRGGTGDDRLVGGIGEDTFVFEDVFGSDRIENFDLTDDDGDGRAADRLDISGLTGGSGPAGEILYEDITFGTSADGFASLSFPGGEQIELRGISPSQMQTRGQARSAGLPCFTPGTAIETPGGPVPIERLRPGDLVCTRDDGPRPILWAGRSSAGPDRLRAEPRLAPVWIAPGAFGAHGAMTVSPQHGVLLRHDGEERMVRAAVLARIAGHRARRIRGCSRVSYLHLLLERHQAVRAEGLWSETFYPGPWALAGLETGARRAIFRLFPALTFIPVAEAYGPRVRATAARQDLPDVLRALVAA
ncbi:MAG: Hint domain-containing protein, partial [Pseudomonadota bacterium]